MSDTTCGHVCIDELVTVLAEYDPRNRWNGFLACPYMDALSVVEVLDALDASAPEYAYDYVFADDGALTLTDRQYRDEDPEHYVPEVLTPNVDGLYSLGAYGWVWSEDETADAATPEPVTREYVVGLPVVVTVREDGWIAVDVDLSEVGQAISEDDTSEGRATWWVEQALNAELADEWATRHAVQNEGWAR